MAQRAKEKWRWVRNSVENRDGSHHRQEGDSKSGVEEEEEEDQSESEAERLTLGEIVDAGGCAVEDDTEAEMPAPHIVRWVM